MTNVFKININFTINSISFIVLLNINTIYPCALFTTSIHIVIAYLGLTKYMSKAVYVTCSLLVLENWRLCSVIPKN